MEYPKKEDNANHYVRNLVCSSYAVKNGDKVHKFFGGGKIDLYKNIRVVDERIGISAIAIIRIPTVSNNIESMSICGIYKTLIERNPYYFVSNDVVDGSLSGVGMPDGCLIGVGMFDGGSIAIGGIADAIGVTASIKDSLILSKVFGRPVWATGDKLALEFWKPPEAIKEVTIFFRNGDFDSGAAAYNLAKSLKEKIHVSIEEIWTN